jgi:hypothetical protein
MSGSLFVWTVVCTHKTYRELGNIRMNSYKCVITQTAPATQTLNVALIS